MTRGRSWLTWIFAPFALLLVIAAGRALFLTSFGGAVHPDPQSVPSSAPEPAPPRWTAAAGQVRLAIRSAMAAGNVPGLSVAVGSGGEIVFAEGFGWADLESQTPVTPRTHFRLGTASTLLTAAAAGVLVDQGRMRLDEEIQKYVPQYPRKQWPVTVRELLAGKGGIESGAEDEDAPLFRERCTHPLDAVPHFAAAPLQFQPGSRIQPSSYGWVLVSAAVASAAEQPFLPYLRQAVFQPLGMSRTGAESAAEENPQHIGEPGEDAPPFVFVRQVILQPLGIAPADPRPVDGPAAIYVPGFGPRARYGLQPMRVRNLSCYAGAMALYSTPSDLVRFGMAVNGGTFLRPETVTELHAADGGSGELLGSRLVSLYIIPESGIVAAVASNRADTDTAGLALEIARAFAQAR